MVKLLRSGGLMIFTCASTGREEHGTLRSRPEDAPFLPGVDEKWGNYYKNLTEDDIRECIDIDSIFSDYKFEVETNHFDLYFYGIKK